MSGKGTAGCSKNIRRRGAPETKVIAGVEVTLGGRDLYKAKQVGGKGSMRRKAKGKRASNNNDARNRRGKVIKDARLDAFYTDRGLSFFEVPEIQEVNLFRGDGTYIEIKKASGAYSTLNLGLKHSRQYTS